jgi:hypothetical protein
VFGTLGFSVSTVESCLHAVSLFSEHAILLPLLGFLSSEDFQFNLHMHMPEIMNMLHILQVLPCNFIIIIFWEEYHFKTYYPPTVFVFSSLVHPNVIHSSSILDVCCLHIVMMQVIHEQKLHEILRLHYS